VVFCRDCRPEGFIPEEVYPTGFSCRVFSGQVFEAELLCGRFQGTDSRWQVSRWRIDGGDLTVAVSRGFGVFIGFPSGFPVWVSCLGFLSGFPVWVSCLGFLSGFPVGVVCRGFLSGFSIGVPVGICCRVFQESGFQGQALGEQVFWTWKSGGRFPGTRFPSGFPARFPGVSYRGFKPWFPGA
jgi:hypothetical protein